MICESCNKDKEDVRFESFTETNICDKCGNEDSINCFSGLCSTCDRKEIEEKFEGLQEENNEIRGKIAILIADLKPKIQTKLLKLIGELVNIEIEMEQECNQ